MNRQGMLLFMAVLLVAIITIGFNTFRQHQKSIQFLQTENAIDYYLSDFTLLKLNSNGSMRYLIKGTQLIHQQRTDTTSIISPLLQAKSDNGSLTQLTADKAKQVSKNGSISLLGDVSMVKNLSNPSKKIKLKTRNLLYNPIERNISSISNVALLSSSGIIKGVGFSSHLDEQVIRIHANVHSEYQPSK